jgi:hypothetical protein
MYELAWFRDWFWLATRKTVLKEPRNLTPPLCGDKKKADRGVSLVSLA